MQLRCPHCRSLVRIAEAMRRYFGMPVRCHECARVFVVLPQSPLYDSALPADGPVMRCSHCDAELGTSEARGIGTSPVILALVIGIIARCGVLWLDHARLIMLRNLDASRLLVTMKGRVGDWWVSLEQLRWRDWCNPPSE